MGLIQPQYVTMNFETVDRDDWATDLNDGDGRGITLAYKYKLSEHASIGVEYLTNGYNTSEPTAMARQKR